MPDLETWLIIILIIGVIVSNLAVLKYNAKMKMTHFGKKHKQTKIKTNDNVNPNSQSKAGIAKKPPSTSLTKSKDDSDKDTGGTE